MVERVMVSVLVLILIASVTASPLHLNSPRAVATPSADTQAKARRVGDALEQSPNVYENAARELFAAVRAGQEAGRTPDAGLWNDLLAAEANSKEQAEIGQVLLYQLHELLRDPHAGALDAHAEYVWRKLRTYLCITSLWWNLAKEQLKTSTTVGVDELQAFQEVLYYVQPCLFEPLLPSSQ